MIPQEVITYRDTDLREHPPVRVRSLPCKDQWRQVPKESSQPLNWVGASTEWLAVGGFLWPVAQKWGCDEQVDQGRWPEQG